MKKTIIILALIGSFSVSNSYAQTTSKASTAERKAQSVVEKMSESLNLTPQQKKAIYQKTVTFHQQQDAIQVTLDTSKIEQQSKQVEANNTAYESEIDQLLNDQQKQQWQQVKAQAQLQSKQKAGLR